MKLITAFCALAMAAPFTPASAEPEARIEIAVRHADLDLRTEAGKRVLDRRIRIAVQTACGTPSAIDLKSDRLAKRCRMDAVSRVAINRDTAVALASRPRSQELAAQ